MILNKLLVANVMVGITIILQGLIPMIYVKEQDSFWMYITAVVFLVLAVIASASLILVGRSACIATMAQMKVAIYHSPPVGFSFLSLIFFILYAFVPDISKTFAAVRNMALVLVVGAGLLLVISLIIVLVAFKMRPEVTQRGGTKLKSDSDREDQ